MRMWAACLWCSGEAFLRLPSQDEPWDVRPVAGRALYLNAHFDKNAPLHQHEDASTGNAYCRPLLAEVLRLICCSGPAAYLLHATGG